MTLKDFICTIFHTCVKGLLMAIKKQIIEENKNGHKHEWKAYAKTKKGKIRYKCSQCGKTCTEFSHDLAKKYYRMNLRLINSYTSSDDELYKWEEVINYDDNGDITDYVEQPYYKIEKRHVTWKQFQRIIRQNNFSPLIVYTVKENDISSSLCLYEVIFDN